MSIPAISNTNVATRINNQNSQQAPSNTLNNQPSVIEKSRNDTWNFSINKKKAAKFAAIITIAAAIFCAVKKKKNSCYCKRNNNTDTRFY